MKQHRRLAVLMVIAAPLTLALAAVFLVLLARQGGLEPFRVPAGGSAPSSSSELIERGRYLATLGNCMGCHTASGGAVLAGGREFRTEYGTVFSSNLTPHMKAGIGAWSNEEFRHAMRHGVSRNGVLSPVFPYASFRHLTNDDLDALLAFLHTVPAAENPRPQNAFVFPANLPGAMAAWRLLYYRPLARPAPADASFARGAYLVEGIGHCATCHAGRGAFASQTGGGQLWGARSAGWFAPALHGVSLEHFAAGDVARYLKGEAPGAQGAYGLMADVVAGNLQHLADGDAQAIETYLRALPPPPKRKPTPSMRASSPSIAAGRAAYERHCSDCHGKLGEGVEGTYPPLRGSSAISQEDPINLIKLILFGAVAPSTSGNPMPHTMPPFAQTLTADQIAEVVNFLRLQANANAVPIGAGEVRAMGGIW